MNRASIDKPVAKTLRAVLITLTMSVAVSCGNEPQGSAEEQLRNWLSAAEAHAEAKERRALLDMISPTYTDAKGNEIGDLEDRLRYWFFRSQGIELLTSVDDIRVFDGSAAEMDVTVAMAGTDNSAFGFSADAYRYSLELILQEGEWILISADWSKLGR